MARETRKSTKRGVTFKRGWSHTRAQNPTHPSVTSGHVWKSGTCTHFYARPQQQLSQVPPAKRVFYRIHAPSDRSAKQQQLFNVPSLRPAGARARRCRYGRRRLGVLGDVRAVCSGVRSRWGLEAADEGICVPSAVRRTTPRSVPRCFRLQVLGREMRLGLSGEF